MAYHFFFNLKKKKEKKTSLKSAIVAAADPKCLQLSRGTNRILHIPADLGARGAVGAIGVKLFTLIF